MKIQLTKTLPQPELGRVIPAGVIIDAPPALAERLLRQGRGKPVQPVEAPETAQETPENGTPENGTPENIPENNAPETALKGPSKEDPDETAPEKPSRKKVNRNG